MYNNGRMRKASVFAGSISLIAATFVAGVTQGSIAYASGQSHKQKMGGVAED
jgi:hypothetical protein